MALSSMIFLFLSIILPLRAGIDEIKAKAPGLITERLRNIPPTTHANAPRQGEMFVLVFESLYSMILLLLLLTISQGLVIK